MASDLTFTEKQIIDYLNSDGKELFELANSVRKKFVGDEIHLRGLIEISNYCKRNCFYCGIRNSNKKNWQLPKQLPNNIHDEKQDEKKKNTEKNSIAIAKMVMSLAVTPLFLPS